jgi:hypothetical protein
MLKRRRWFVVVGAAVATVVLVYLPHVVAVGSSVVGYLPTYLNQGGYSDGHQYRLLATVLPNAARTPVAIAIVLAAVVYALLRADPAHPEQAALVVMGTSLLVATPPLPWYTLLLLALAALAARPEWLGVVVAPTIGYLLVGTTGVSIKAASVWCYFAGLAILLLGIGGRHLVRNRRWRVPGGFGSTEVEAEADADADALFPPISTANTIRPCIPLSNSYFAPGSVVRRSANN